MDVIEEVISVFTTGKPRTGKKEVILKDKELRENLKDKQVDKMVEDSFPASDPPSNY